MAWAAWMNRGAVMGMALLALVNGGCVSLLGGNTPGPNEPPPPGVPPCQALVCWNPQVRFAPDSVRGGALNPGLMGRVYLLGGDGGLVVGEGGIVVDLYDESQGKSVLLEEWRFDKDACKKMLQKDGWGWGYSVFLPWGTYKPEIARVHLKVQYASPKGLPLYAQSEPMTLRRGDEVSAGMFAPPGRTAPVPQTAHNSALPPGPTLPTQPIPLPAAPQPFPAPQPIPTPTAEPPQTPVRLLNG